MVVTKDKNMGWLNSFITMIPIRRQAIFLWLGMVLNITVQADQSNAPQAGIVITNAKTQSISGFEVLSNRWRTLLGISNFGGMSAPNSLPPPQFAPPPSSPPWLNTNLDTNFTVMETSNIVPHDAMEFWLLKSIQDKKDELQKPGLDQHSRQMIELALRQFQGQWDEHESQVESNKTLVANIRSNPRGALTNMPDPIAQALSLSVMRAENELSDPTLPAYRRQALETISATYKQQLADHETNAQLWLDLRLAQASKDGGKVADAEHKLADYLAAKIGKPKGMSLDTVMEEYKKRSGDYHSFNNRTIIRAIIIAFLLLPPVVMLFKAIRGRASK
jgi:hypothetical protein